MFDATQNQWRSALASPDDDQDDSSAVSPVESPDAIDRSAGLRNSATSTPADPAHATDTGGTPGATARGPPTSQTISWSTLAALERFRYKPAGSAEAAPLAVPSTPIPTGTASCTAVSSEPSAFAASNLSSNLATTADLHYPAAVPASNSLTSTSKSSAKSLAAASRYDLTATSRYDLPAAVGQYDPPTAAGPSRSRVFGAYSVATNQPDPFNSTSGVSLSRDGTSSSGAGNASRRSGYSYEAHWTPYEQMIADYEVDYQQRNRRRNSPTTDSSAGSTSSSRKDSTTGAAVRAASPDLFEVAARARATASESIQSSEPPEEVDEAPRKKRKTFASDVRTQSSSAASSALSLQPEAVHALASESGTSSLARKEVWGGRKSLFADKLEAFSSRPPVGFPATDPRRLYHSLTSSLLFRSRTRTGTRRDQQS